MSVGVCTIVHVDINGQHPICSDPLPEIVNLGEGMLIIGTANSSPYFTVYDTTALPFEKIDVLPEGLTFNNQVNCLAVSPAKDILIVGGGRIGSTALADRPYVFDISQRPWADISETVIPEAVWNANNEVFKALISPDGDLVFLYTEAHNLRVFNRSAGDAIPWAEQSANVYDSGDVRFDRMGLAIKGNLLAATRRADFSAGATAGAHLNIFDITTNPISKITDIIFNEHRFNSVESCNDVDFHPSQNFITATTLSDVEVVGAPRTSVISYTEGPFTPTEIDDYVTPEPSANNYRACKFSPDGKFVAYGKETTPDYLQMFEADDANNNPAISFDLGTVTSTVYDLDFSADSKYLAVASVTTSLTIFDMTSGTPTVTTPPTYIPPGAGICVLFTS